MPSNDLPVTVTAQSSQALPSTTAAEMATAGEDPGGLDLRGYELIERLGGGGMGDVYRAGDPALGRDLAVKVMKADWQGHASAEQRFLREAQVTGSLQHPGIVPIYNLGRLADGRLHYTMRLVRGRTLAEILKDEAGRPERLPALLAIFEKVCQAMAYAHSERVLHRDLKPANVMVGRFGEVQVMDWGLAKRMNPDERGCVSALSAGERGCVSVPSEVHGALTQPQSPEEQTQMGQEMGTPAYMPLEQARGAWDAVDERADVFALGAILCQILTGHPPYRGRDSMEILDKAKQGDTAEALAQLQTCGADAALLQLCRECLAQAPEDRPRDAEQVAQRVAAYQTEVQDRLRRAELERAEAVVKAREERKRRRLAIGFVGLLAIAAAVGVWLAVQATHSAQAERQANNLAQNRLGQIEKANDVLASIFQDLDPRAEDRGGASFRVQIAQHIEKAAGQLDEVAIGDPVSASRLQYTLGRSLGSLGQTRQSIALMNKAYQVQESQLGPNHAETLTTMMELGMAYHANGQLDRSVTLLEQCLERRKNQFGESHPDTLRTECALAGIYIVLHQFDKAEPHVRALEAQEAAPELVDLAMAYRLTGQPDNALRLSEFVVKLYTAKKGPDDPKTLASMTGLAAGYQQIGQVNRAIQLYEEILRKQRAKLPPDHQDRLTTMQNLGLAYCTVGQREKGVALMEKSWERWKIKFGIDSPTAQPRRIALARVHQMAGKFARADALLREGLNAQRIKADPNSPTALRLRTMLGFNLLRQHKSTEAEPILRECLKAREARQPKSWETFHTRSLLGEALLDQRKYAEAEPLLLQGYQGLKEQEKKIPVAYRSLRLSEAVRRVVQLYEATSQKDKATDWRKKLPKVNTAG